MLGDLSVRVSKVLVPLVRALDGAAGGPSLAVWADLLRVVPELGASEAELTRLAHVSPRSMHVLVGASADAGWVEAEGNVTSGRVSLTLAGAAARDRMADSVAAHDHALGPPPAWAEVRSAAAAAAATVTEGLPWLLLPYGPADGRAAIGPATPSDVDVDVDAPAFALLSQVLAAWTVAYESRHGWMLSMIATALEGFPDDGLPVRAIHHFAGVKGDGKTLHERHHIVDVRDGVATLTARGRVLRDAHQPTLRDVERAWAANEGAVLERLRAALQALPRGAADPAVRHLCMGPRSRPTGFAELSSPIRATSAHRR